MSATLRSLTVVVGLLVVEPVLVAQQAPTMAREATTLPYLLVGDHIPAPMRLSSPDGRNVLVARQGDHAYHGQISTEFFVERAGHRLRGKIEPFANPEAAWSPDSHAFWITSTDGGIVGAWNVQVFVIAGDHVREVDVTRDVRRDLARRFPPCDFRGIPGPCTVADEPLRASLDWVNVYAFHWIDGSKKLLLAAGVPPSSGYGRNMGKLVGYVVEVPSARVLSSASECEFARRWKEYIGTFAVCVK